MVTKKTGWVVALGVVVSLAATGCGADTKKELRQRQNRSRRQRQRQRQHQRQRKNRLHSSSCSIPQAVLKSRRSAIW